MLTHTHTHTHMGGCNTISSNDLFDFSLEDEQHTYGAYPHADTCGAYKWTSLVNPDMAMLRGTLHWILKSFRYLRHEVK